MCRPLCRLKRKYSAYGEARHHYLADIDGDGNWTLDACDESCQRWLVHHDDLLAAVVLLGEMLGVEWEDG